jgi:hypothetical protein
MTLSTVKLSTIDVWLPRGTGDSGPAPSSGNELTPGDSPAPGFAAFTAAEDPVISASMPSCTFGGTWSPCASPIPPACDWNVVKNHGC